MLGDPQLRQVAWFTLWQAAASTVLTLVLALPAAQVLARYEFRGPPLRPGARHRAVRAPHRRGRGRVPGAARARGARSALDLQGSAWAILLAHAFFNHAVVVRTVGGLWEGLDPRTEEAARVLGRVAVAGLPRGDPARAAPGDRVGGRHHVPLHLHLASGSSASSAARSRTTLEVEIYRQTADLLDLPVASVLALLQLAAVGAMLVVQDRLERRRATDRRRAARRRGRRRATGRGERLWVGGNLVAPGAVPRRSRSPCWSSAPSGPATATACRRGGRWRGSTRARGCSCSPLEAVGNSLRFAAVATVIAVVLGGMAAAALARSDGRVARLVDGVLLLPLGTSAVTVGFGFLIALDEPVDLRASPWLVPIAQAVVALPFVVRTMTPVLRSIDPRLRDAAAVLGASPRAGVARGRPAAGAAGRAGGRRASRSRSRSASSGPPRSSPGPTRRRCRSTIARLLGRPGPLNAGQAFALSTVLMVLTASAVLLVDRWRPRAGRSRGLGVTARVDAGRRDGSVRRDRGARRRRPRGRRRRGGRRARPERQRQVDPAARHRRPAAARRRHGAPSTAST